MTVIINGTTGITNVNGSAAAPAETGTDTDTGIVYGTNTVTIATGGTAGLVQNSVQGVQVPNTLGVGATTPSTSGAGITFPGVPNPSSSSNTLDDYEEGSFTGTITPGAGTLTSGLCNGYYVKVGRQVTITMQFWINNPGTASGTVTLGGLPFTTINPGFTAGNRAGTSFWREDASTGVWYAAYIAGGGTTMVVSTLTNGAIVWSSGYTYVTSFVYESAN